MKLSVAGRIFLGIVLIQLISAGLIFGWVFYSVRSEINNLALLNSQETVLRSIEATEEYFRPAGDAVLAAQRLLAGNVLDRDRPDQLGRYFFEQLRERPQFAGFYVGYPDGGFVYVMRSDQGAAGGTRTKIIRTEPGGREVELIWRDPAYAMVRADRDPEDSYDPRTRPWYRDALAKGDVVWTKPYIFFTSHTPGITVASAIMNDDGTAAGVVGVDMEMSEVSKFLRQIAFARGNAAFVVNPEGEVIAHSSLDVLLPDSVADEKGLRFRKLSELEGLEGAVRDRIVKRIDQQSGTDAPTVWQEKAGGKDHFVAVGRMSSANWPWLIVAVVPETSLFEVARTGNLILAGVILLATALASAAGYALAQSIGRPLAVLHGNAKLARRGNVEMMEEVTSGYREVDETSDALHDLARLRRRHGAPGEAQTKDG